MLLKPTIDTIVLTTALLNCMDCTQSPIKVKDNNSDNHVQLPVIRPCNHRALTRKSDPGYQWSFASVVFSIIVVTGQFGLLRD